MPLTSRSTNFLSDRTTLALDHPGGSGQASSSPHKPDLGSFARSHEDEDEDAVDDVPRRSSGHSSHGNQQHPHTSSSSSPSMDSSGSGSSSTPPSPHPPRRLRLNVFSKRKGVHYNADGGVRACRFCNILRLRDEQFLYEDESLVVFRPLHPIVPSHILIVPRAHLRNVNHLTADHATLLRRMRTVADKVLATLPCVQQHATRSSTSSDDCESADKRSKNQSHKWAEKKAPQPTTTHINSRSGLVDEEDEQIHDEPGSGQSACRFAFHVPPFNSIDHVHMHAFRGSTGYLGRVKYRTKSWWCRSYDEVLARLQEEEQDTSDASIQGQ